jgi:hypothetical protein
LLTRNLQDVFGENDPARRRAAIEEIFTEDCVFYDPTKGGYRGRDEIDRVAGAIKATHPDFRYQPIAEPEQLGNGGRIQWVSGRPGATSLLLIRSRTSSKDWRLENGLSLLHRTALRASATLPKFYLSQPAIFIIRAKRNSPGC